MHDPRSQARSDPSAATCDLFCRSYSTRAISRTSFAAIPLKNSPRHQVLALSVAVGLFLFGCGSGLDTTPKAPPTSASAADLTPYEGPLRVLFDDAIDPEVFSTSAEMSLGTSDKRLSERIRNASFVVTVAVATVTDEKSGSSGRLELELLPVDRPIRGSLTAYVSPGETIKVRLGSASAGYALVRSNQNELVGKRLNLCWGRFANGGKVVDHWHAFADTPRARVAIAKAAAIVNFD